MKTVFVSVPMSGKDDALVKRAIQVTIKKYLEKTRQTIREVKFVNGLDYCEGCDFSYLKHVNLGYLSMDLYLLGQCDEAIFGEGWQDARGCKIERKVCEEYGIPIIEGA